MSREVDERIVEMQFDNKQFEQGVNQTIKSLDNLTNALKFDGLSDSLKGIQNGVNNLDFSPISNGVSALEGTLTSLVGRIKLEVFDRIANYAVDTGEKVLNAITLKGAKAGMAEYETQMGAVQTILANTQHLGTTVEDVNKALDNLNEYADLTIYNFTQMTKNIGTFTAAGLDLETSTSAIKGIANLAAVSGSTSEQASRAMYQLSQALAAGRVNLQDWNSVVNAGMGGKVFQDALKRTAKHMGIAVDESINFRESISSQSGTSWLTADVLSETLKQFSGDLSEAQLLADGWSKTEVDEITKMAKTATDAATVVKTFSQLMSTVSEQIGSGWTKTWQLIFGDFEESKALWTSVYKAVSPYVDAISDLRNEQLKFWKENEGRAKVLEAFSNIWSGLSNTVDKFTSAFRKAFPIVDNLGQKLVDISEKFLAFSERFKVVKDKAEQVSDAFSNVSDAIGKITAEDKKNALDIWNWGNINGNPGRIDGQDRVDALGESYDRVQKYINTFIETGYDVAKTDELLGVGADEAAKAIEKTGEASAKAVTEEEKRDIVLTNLVKTLRSLADVAKVIGGSVLKTVKAAGQAFADVFDPIGASSDLASVSSVLAKVSKAFEITAEKAEDLRRIFRGVFAAFDIVYQLIKAVASAITKAFLPSLDAVDSASGGLLKVLGNFGDWVVGIDEAIKKGDLFGAAIDSMGGFFGKLTVKIKDSIDAFQEWSGIDFGSVTKKIGSAISKGLDKLKGWTGIDIKAIFANIWKSIKTFIDLIKKGDFTGAFSFVTNGIKNFVTGIVDTIKKIDFSAILGNFGETFGKFGEWISKIFENGFGSIFKSSEKSAGEAKQSIGFFDIIGGIFYGAYLVVKKIIDIVWDLLQSPQVETIKTAIGEFFSNLFNKPEEEGASEQAGEKAGSFLERLGEALANFYEDVKPLIGAGFIGGFIKIFSDLSSTALNFSKAPLVLSKSIENLAKGFDNLTKSFKLETMTRFIKGLADSVLKLVIAIIALILIDEHYEGGIAGATAVVTTLLGEIIGALVIANQKLDAEIDMAFMVSMIKQLGKTMLTMAAALFIIAKIGNPAKIAVTVGAFTAAMSEMTGLLVILATLAKDKRIRRAKDGMVMLTAALQEIAIAMVIMGVALVVMSKVPTGKLGVTMWAMIESFGALSAMITVVALLAKEVGQGKADEIAALGATLMMIASSFVLIAPAILLLSLIPADKLSNGLKAVAEIAAIFTAVMGVTELLSKGGTNSKAIAAAGLSMMLIALAIDMILPSLIALSILNPEQLGAGLVAMGLALLTMVASLVILSTIGSGLAVAAGGLLAVALAIAIITPSLMLFAAAAWPVIQQIAKKLEEANDEKISKLAKKILKMAGALAVLGLAFIVFGAGLAVVSVALVILGVATLIMTPFTIAIGNLLNALNSAAKNWPKIKTMLSEMGPVLGSLVTDFLSSLIDGIGKVAKSIKKAAPIVAEAVVAVIMAIFECMYGYYPQMIERGLQLIDLILDALIEYMPSVLDKLGQVITILLNWINLNIPGWTETLVEILVGFVVGVINGLSDRAGDIVDAIFKAFIKWNNALADGMDNNGDELIASIDNVIKAFFRLVKKSWITFEKNVEQYGGDFIDWVVQGLEEHGGNIIDWLVTLFTDKIPEGIKNVWGDVKQLGKDLVEAIKDGVIEGWTTAKEAVEQFGTEFIDCLKVGWGIESPSKATQELGKYLSDGVYVGMNKNKKKVFKEVDKFGSDTTDKIDDALDIDTDYNMDTDMALKLDIDTTAIDSFDIHSLFGGDELTAIFGTGLDTSSIMANATSAMEQQRHEDTEESNGIMQTLVDQLKGLSETMDGGIITIPENATFTIPVNVDGQTIATASAPYLDTIQADGYNLEAAGVTSW